MVVDEVTPRPALITPLKKKRESRKKSFTSSMFIQFLWQKDLKKVAKNWHHVKNTFFFFLVENSRSVYFLIIHESEI